jgi:hypothetical protein
MNPKNCRDCWHMRVRVPLYCHELSKNILKAEIMWDQAIAQCKMKCYGGKKSKPSRAFRLATNAIWKAPQNNPHGWQFKLDYLSWQRWAPECPHFESMDD